MFNHRKSYTLWRHLVQATLEHKDVHVLEQKHRSRLHRILMSGGSNWLYWVSLPCRDGMTRQLMLVIVYKPPKCKSWETNSPWVLRLKLSWSHRARVLSGLVRLNISTMPPLSLIAPRCLSPTSCFCWHPQGIQIIGVSMVTDLA